MGDYTPILVSQGQHVQQPLNFPIAAIGGDNGTPFYLFLPAMPPGLQFVFPFTYGFRYPLPQTLPRQQPFPIWADQTPTGFPAAPTSALQAKLTAFEDAGEYSAGIRAIQGAGWTFVGSKTLGAGADSITTSVVPPTTKSLILVTGNGIGFLTPNAAIFLQGLSSLTLYAGPPTVGASGSLAGVYVFPANGQSDSQYTLNFATGGSFGVSIYASDSIAPTISQGQQKMNYSLPVTIASDQSAVGVVGAVALPTNAVGSVALAVTQAVRKATYMVEADAITTGALVAATEKQLLSLEHSAAAIRTTRVKRIVLNAVITAAGAAAGGIEFYLKTGTAASSAGTAVTPRATNQRIAGVSEVTAKTLPTIVAATGPMCVHGTWAPAAAGPLSETSDIVLYQWVPGDAEELSLRAAVLESLVLCGKAVSTPTLTVYITIELTEE